MESKKLVAIRHSAISGHGTFAKEKIAKGSFIRTLEGEPFTKNVARDANKTDPLQVDDEVMLSLDYPSKTINHSCKPNAGIRNRSDLYALVDINIGDEIVYDYSTTVGVDDEEWSMPCCCGHAVCRKEIRYVLSIPKETLARYADQDALPAFIRRQLGLT